MSRPDVCMLSLLPVFGRGELGMTFCLFALALVFFWSITWPALWKKPLCEDVKSVTNIYRWGMQEHGEVPARLTVKFTAHFGTSHSHHTGLKFLFLMRSCCHILLAFCALKLWIPYFSLDKIFTFKSLDEGLHPLKTTVHLMMGRVPLTF